MTDSRMLEAFRRKAKTDPALFAAMAEFQVEQIAARAGHYNAVIDRITDEILKRNTTHDTSKSNN